MTQGSGAKGGETDVTNDGKGNHGRGVGRAAAQDYLYARLAELAKAIATKRGAAREEARRQRDFLWEQQKIAHAERRGIVRLDPELERAVRESTLRPRGPAERGAQARRKTAGAKASPKKASPKKASPKKAPAPRADGARTPAETGPPALGLRDRAMVVDGFHWAYGQVGRVIALTPQSATIRLSKSGGLHSSRNLGPALEVGRDQLRSMEAG